jgi:hypothetical protein
MKKEKLLFLMQSQLAVITKRRDVYIQACRHLQDKRGYETVFVYNGPRFADEADFPDIKFEHFDTWVAQNAELIRNTNVRDLERELPECNLWRIAVVERRITDYSFLTGVKPYSHYTTNEIDNIIKELVCFTNM